MCNFTVLFVIEVIASYGHTTCVNLKHKLSTVVYKFLLSSLAPEMFCTHFVPYSHLTTEPLPISLCGGAVDASIRLLCVGGIECELRLHRSFKFDTNRSVAVVASGDVFDVAYRDRISEVRIGRRIIVSDA